MKVAIIGCGASGASLAIMLKKGIKDVNIDVFDYNNNALKKIKASGNGRCNFANKDYRNGNYSNKEFVYPILQEFDHNKIIKFFNELGIKETNINDLYYPYSFSAQTVYSKMINTLSNLNVNIINEKVYDYKIKDKIIINDKYDGYDYLIISSGAKSNPKLGSDGEFYKSLITHGYKIKELKPGLTPIKIKENVKNLDGVRCKGIVNVLIDNKNVYQEDGEILFKKDGLSGIAIFNASSIIARYNSNDVKIKISLVKDNEFGIPFATPKELYEAYVHPKLVDYLLKLENQDLKIAKTLVTELTFTYKDSYGFDFSQVSVGGVSISNLKENLESKLEKNIFFIGEVIDVDALCGGFNLMWAFASANKVYKTIKGE